MYWILFALLGPLFWGITNLFDKYLLEKYVSNAYVYLFLTGVINLVVLCGVIFWGFHIPALPIIFASLIAGALFNYQMLPYFKALQITEASRVIPLYQFTPLFTLFFSFIFLHEHLSIQAGIAFILLTCGGFLISLEQIDGVFKISKAFFYMIVACCLYAFYLILSRYVYIHVSYTTGLVWETIGGFISVLPLLLSPTTRGDIASLFVNVKISIKSLLLINQLINLCAILFIQLALSTGSAALISALGGIQPLYVLILSAIVSTLFPHILKEDTTLKTLAHKALAIMLILLGVLLVTL